MSYRVCIPTAGTGSRLGSLTKYVNKSLVGIANRPTLSHIIEQFPEDVEFVVALGHKGDLVREFIEIAYPHRTFHFAKVDPFGGPGSGLGLSLLACREFLREPFVFNSCDTLVDERIPAPTHNWMAFAERPDHSQYRTVIVRDGAVCAILEKGERGEGSVHPYIGLAGIHDHQAFWDAMEADRAVAIDRGETHGLRALVPARVAALHATWYDTGNIEELERTRRRHQREDAPNVLEKLNEAIWFVADLVVKFSDDQAFIANRVARARELGDYVPRISASRRHMYSYPMAEGRVLSKIATVPLFGALLDHCQGFWRRAELDDVGRADFRKACLKFYRDKTLERVDLFYKTFGREDSATTINGVAMPRLDQLLSALDWDWVADGLAGRFHGDFHFENILWNDTAGKFIFLDWRQDFCGDLTVGDVYYDLAKLLHGLIICHELIVKDLYWVDWRGEAIDYDFNRKQALVACERYFHRWLEDEGFDSRKVRVMTALVYLNIAALHHHPYSLLLFALGKTMLFLEIDHERH